MPEGLSKTISSETVDLCLLAVSSYRETNTYISVFLGVNIIDLFCNIFFGDIGYSSQACIHRLERS